MLRLDVGRLHSHMLRLFALKQLRRRLVAAESSSASPRGQRGWSQEVGQWSENPTTTLFDLFSLFLLAMASNLAT